MRPLPVPSRQPDALALSGLSCEVAGWAGVYPVPRCVREATAFTERHIVMKSIGSDER